MLRLRWRRKWKNKAAIEMIAADEEVLHKKTGT